MGNTVDEPSIEMSPERLAYMLGSTALSVVVEVPVEPLVVVVELSPDVELAVVPSVAAGVSAEGPQAADIRTIAQAATAISISNRIGKLFRMSNLGELIDPPRIGAFVGFRSVTRFR